MEYRLEHDTMGEVKVPADKFWGAQTERSRNNFKIGPEASMPLEVVYGFAYLKKAAAHTNHALGVLAVEKRDLISKVCDEKCKTDGAKEILRMQRVLRRFERLKKTRAHGWLLQNDPRTRRRMIVFAATTA